MPYFDGIFVKFLYFPFYFLLGFHLIPRIRDVVVATVIIAETGVVSFTIRIVKLKLFVENRYTIATTANTAVINLNILFLTKCAPESSTLTDLIRN